MGLFGGHDFLSFASEAVGVSFEDDDFGVVDETVDHGGGGDGVPEYLRPGGEALVGGDDERGPFVAG